jgi:hypothetical protein
MYGLEAANKGGTLDLNTGRPVYALENDVEVLISLANLNVETDPASAKRYLDTARGLAGINCVALDPIIFLPLEARVCTYLGLQAAEDAYQKGDLETARVELRYARLAANAAEIKPEIRERYTTIETTITGEFDMVA